MKLLIAGGASYIGAWLVPQLLADGHGVTVYDTLLFGGGYLPKDNEMLDIIKADIRDLDAWKSACDGQDAVIYLASISREALCQAKPELAHDINVKAFRPLVVQAKHCGIKRFIYASSVAVYGSSELSSAEDAPQNPTTIYGIGKKACETMLWDYQSKDFVCTVTRSASVCGYSPRMRLDLTINRMVHDAMRRGSIVVEGGNQVRSHVHIQDLCDFYKLMLAAPRDAIRGEAFNVVCANQSVKDSALMVARICGNVEIDVRARVDDRSYLVDGGKAKAELGWEPERSIERAVIEMKAKFDSGYWKDSLTNPIYQNMV